MDKTGLAKKLREHAKQFREMNMQWRAKDCDDAADMLDHFGKLMAVMCDPVFRDEQKGGEA